MKYSHLPYPMVYAIEPINKYIKTDVSVPLGYIVTKAFVINESTLYTPTKIKKTYQVVYPIKGYQNYRLIIEILEYLSLIHMIIV